MNIPRFTAEDSLYKMNERYQETVTHKIGNDNAVRPASCYGDCVHECIYERGGPRPGACIRICRFACQP